MDSNRKPREGLILLCEANDCEAFTVYKSYKWSKEYRLVWIEAIGKHLTACSDACADRIRAGKYRELNNKCLDNKRSSESQPTAPGATRSSSVPKAKQLELFR